MFNFIWNLLKRAMCSSHNVITYKQCGYCVVEFCRNCEYLKCVDVHKGKCKPPEMLDRERQIAKLDKACREKGYICCPDCSSKMLQGPSGGLNINYACPECNGRFNLAFYEGRLEMLERTGKVDAATMATLFYEQSKTGGLYA